MSVNDDLRSTVEGNATTQRLWVADPDNFSTRQAGRLQHTFHTHPLLQLPALEELAEQLMPLDQCRFIRPITDPGFGFLHHHRDHWTIAEVFRRLEEPRSWIALYNVEVIPRYAALLSEILGHVRPMVEREQGRIFMETGFIFISAPPSLTPFHIDRENNFWLQLHGRKTMNVWSNADRLTIPAPAVEDFIVAQSLRTVRYEEEMQPRSLQVDVGPGDGIYFPSTSPHMTRSERDWVRPGDGVSVSFGVNFYTEATRRTARVHQVNRLLRKSLHMTPRLPGQSTRIDALKAPIGHLLGAGRQWGKVALSPLLLRRRAAPPPPGSY